MKIHILINMFTSMVINLFFLDHLKINQFIIITFTCVPPFLSSKVDPRKLSYWPSVILKGGLPELGNIHQLHRKPETEDANTSGYNLYYTNVRKNN